MSTFVDSEGRIAAGRLRTGQKTPEMTQIPSMAREDSHASSASFNTAPSSAGHSPRHSTDGFAAALTDAVYMHKHDRASSATLTPRQPSFDGGARSASAAASERRLSEDVERDTLRGQSFVGAGAISQSTLVKEETSSASLSPRDTLVERKKKRRKWWIVGAILTGAIILGAVLGGVLGSRHADSSSNPYPLQNIVATGSFPDGSNPDAVTASFSAAPPVSSGTTVNRSTYGRYNSFVVFGASYCDNAHPRPQQYVSISVTNPPYWQGRWSNGPVWTEYLSTLIGPNNSTNVTLIDNAYAGAMIQNNITGASVPDTLTQIQSFTADAAGRNVTVQNAVSGKTLYAIWVGINPVVDIWLKAAVYNGLSATTAATAQATVAKNLVALQTQLQYLLANQTSGDLLLLPLPPVDDLPFVTRKSPYQKATDLMANLSAQFNAGVYNISQQLGSRVMYFNATAVWTNYTSSPSTYNLTDTTDACTDQQCSTPRSFLFWDEIHPTTHIHADFARKLADFLWNNPSAA